MNFSKTIDGFIKFIYVLLLIVTFQACASVTPFASEQSTQEDQVSGGVGQVPIFPHPEGWSDSSFHGMYTIQGGYDACLECHRDGQGEVDAVPCQNCHSSYPHTEEDWSNANGHGATVLENGKTVCKECHADDLTGGNTDASCYQCHTTYPHLEVDWSLPSEHGISALENGLTTCQNCHGSDNQGAETGSSCFKCHTSYPHPTDWSSISEHGQTAKQSQTDACKNCHGSDLKGGTSNTSCYDCHSLYPHTSDWTNGTTHGSFYVSDKSACASDCHGVDLNGGFSEVSCSTCHDAYPHSEDWSDPSADPDWHGSVAEGSASKACENCHGLDLRGGEGGVSCYQCHNDYPHIENWSEKTKHGATVIADGLGLCASNCHGQDLSGGLSEVSCVACHTYYPHASEYSAWSDWKTQSQHGAIAQGSGKSLCSDCHGLDYRGGNTGKSCFQCHEDYPHLDGDWMADGSDSAHALDFIQRITEGETGACTECHGEEYTRQVDGSNCMDCHESGVTHTSEWPLGAGHGVSFSASYKADNDDQPCRSCHGAPVHYKDDLYQDVSIGDCMGCHFISPTTDQTQDSLAAESDCYGCHYAYPHVSYIVFKSEENVAFKSGWGPGNEEGGENGFYYGHTYFIKRSSLYAGAQATCAGTTDGMCHYSGHRSGSDQAGSHNLLCTEYCHQSE